jgi:cell division protein FtsW
MTVPVFLVSMLLLIAVLFHRNREEESGARRWINLGFTTFQPSEAVKIAEIMLFAVMICNYRDKMKTFKYGVLPFAVVVGVICFLLYLEPHLSAAVIIIAIAVAMMFAGGTKKIWFIIGLAAVAVIGVLIVTKMSYASDRISAWLILT